jgi:hypothetical protein
MPALSRPARVLAALSVTAAVLVAAPASATTPAVTSGVYLGGTSATAADNFGVWRGSPVGVLHTFPYKGTWQAIEAPSDATALQGTAYAGSHWLASVGMLPNTGGTLTAGAKGSYDQYWTSLARWLVAHGSGDAWLRLGWEFNHTNTSWTINNGGTKAFVGYWRRIVTAMRKAGFIGRFVFSPGVGTLKSLPDPALAYPGDGYVDAIAPDQYDKFYNHPAATPQQRWQNNLDGAGRGLTYWLSFAETHHKTYGFAEWGLWGAGTVQGGGGDDPYYVQQVAGDLASARAAGLDTFEAYFDVDASDGAHRLTDFPNAAATYRTLFGG